MNTRFKIVAVAIMATLGFTHGASTLAAEPGVTTSSHGEVSKAQREKMAKAHEGAAQCLRSSRAIAECKHEMMSSHAMMREDGCKMMHGKAAQEEQARPAKNGDEHKH